MEPALGPAPHVFDESVAQESQVFGERRSGPDPAIGDRPLACSLIKPFPQFLDRHGVHRDPLAIDAAAVGDADRAGGAEDRDGLVGQSSGAGDLDLPVAPVVLGEARLLPQLASGGIEDRLSFL